MHSRYLHAPSLSKVNILTIHFSKKYLLTLFMLTQRNANERVEIKVHCGGERACLNSDLANKSASQLALSCIASRLLQHDWKASGGEQVGQFVLAFTWAGDFDACRKNTEPLCILMALIFFILFVDPSMFCFASEHPKTPLSSTYGGPKPKISSFKAVVDVAVIGIR